MIAERRCKQRDYCPTPSPSEQGLYAADVCFPLRSFRVSTLTKSDCDVFWSASQQVSGQAGASQASCCWVTLPALCVWADMCACLWWQMRGGTPTDAHGAQTHSRSPLYSEGGWVWPLCVHALCGFSRYLPLMHPQMSDRYFKIKLNLRYFALHFVTFLV